MEFDDSQPPIQADNKTVSQPKELSPDQMVSESGTVRGIKGRVKEQITSNQSKLMLEGLMMKKQQPFARTPLSVIHKADASQTSNNETSLKRYGSQEAISNKESEDVIQRSNSLKTNQSGAKSDGKQKPRGKAPLPPQDKARTKQPQQIQPKPLDHQPTTTPEGQNVTIPAESNKTLQQNTEALMKQTAPPATLPDTEKKVPPKVKPKTARTKSKEAEDNTVIAPEAPKAFHSRSSPHPSLSKRAKSESQIKRTPQGSPRIDRKSAAVIESSEDGQKVLVLSPGGGKANKDTQVRIFLPPPPPILPPCREQEAENDTRPHDTNNITTVDNATIANTEITTVTDKRTGVVTSTVTSQLQSDTIDSGPSSHREQNNKTTKSNPLQQKKKGNHLSDNDDIEVDSEMEAIEPLPQVLFHSLQDLPSTPPGTPCNELEVAEMKISESELNDDDNHDDLDIVPPPPALDDLNIDIADGTISPLPPPDDFDPLSLPPPLSTNDDDFDIILPPPSSSTEDDIVTTTAVPPTLSTADNAIAPITAPPPSSSFLEDDIIGDTTETSQPIEDDETFQDLPITLALPEVSDEAMVAVQAGYDDDDDEIMLNLLPDDVNLSESDTELPAAMNENIVSALESTKPDTIIDAAETDKDEKSISQPNVQAEIITGELENTTSDTPVDVEPEKSVATAEVQQSQDDLSNIIASLETMLQDEPQSNEEQILDDADATSLAWVEPYGNHIPTEAPVDSSKEDTPKAILNQPPSDDLNQTVTITPKPDKGITDIKPMPVAPLPARAAPPPPPLPPIGKVKTPPAMMTSPTKTATSPTKAKSPPPAVKPKPKRPVSETLTEEFQDELAEKLKRRQQKIHDWTKDDEKPKSPTQTTPTIFPTVPSGTVQTKSAAYNTAPVKPNLHAKSIQGAAAPNAQHTSSVGTQQQMEQFQLLQNQMLQQQILQLQQQLQQLQQQIPPGGNPMMAMPQSMSQIGTGVQFPQVGTGMQFPQGANLMQAPQLSTGMQIPMQQQNAIPMHNPMQTAGDGGTLNAAGTHKLTTSMDSDNARSESPPPLPPTSPPPLDNSPNYDQVVRRGINKNASDSALQKRPSSQVLRSRVFGEYEDVLDDILEEVREVDHDTFLRKVSTT